MPSPEIEEDCCQSRCAILSKIAKIRKRQVTPPMMQRNKAKRASWANKYLKADDGWSRGWILDAAKVPLVRLKRKQGGGGVMFRAGIVGDNLI